MSRYLSAQANSKIGRYTSFPVPTTGTFTHLDSLSEAENNYAMSLRAVSLKRLQGFLEMAELEYCDPWFSEDQDADNLDLYEDSETNEIPVD